NYVVTLAGSSGRPPNTAAQARSRTTMPAARPATNAVIATVTPIQPVNRSSSTNAIATPTTSISVETVIIGVRLALTRMPRWNERMTVSAGITTSTAVGASAYPANSGERPAACRYQMAASG